MSKFSLGLKLRRCCLLVTVIYTPSVFAQSLVPFEKWHSDRANWNKDPSEVAYVAMRCAALFNLVGNTFIENGATPKHKEDGRALVGKSDDLMDAGLRLSFSIGMDEKNILARSKSFSDIYSKQLVKNKQLHNNIFEGETGQDFNFCAGRYSFLAELGKQISKGSK